jgi:hypothetical protein
VFSELLARSRVTHQYAGVTHDTSAAWSGPSTAAPRAPRVEPDPRDPQLRLDAFTVTVVTRKACGGAYIAMNARSLGSHTTLAWPGAQIAVMSPVSAVRLHRRSLASVTGELQPAVLEQVLADRGAQGLAGLP